MIVQKEKLKYILTERPRILDVRAPVEFYEGHIPNSVNIPILNDEHRALVGTTYKEKGQSAAIELGHHLVSGELKEKIISQWKDFFKNHPQALLTCFRGGLRSRTTQEWLAEVGVQSLRLEGGYKEARRVFLESLNELPSQMKFLILSGSTGSGKSHLLRQIKHNFSVLDLEDFAKHRGSAFGFEPIPQPSQAQFENEIGLSLMQAQKDLPVLVEDESRMIGKRVVPEVLFSRMRESEVIFVEEGLETRIENIFQDYIQNTSIGKGEDLKAQELFERYQKSLLLISKKLGGLRTTEVLQDLKVSRDDYEKGNLNSNRVWIGKLLTYYYDPLYKGSFERRSPKILFQGRTAEVLEFLQQMRPR